MPVHDHTANTDSQTLYTKHALRSRYQFRFHDPFSAHGFDFVDQFPAHVKCLDIISSTYALAIYKHVRHRPAASALFQGRLQTSAERVLVQFDDVGSGYDAVGFQ